VEYDINPASVPADFNLSGVWAFYARSTQPTSSSSDSVDSDYVVVNGDPGDINVVNPSNPVWLACLPAAGGAGNARILNDVGDIAGFYNYKFGWYSDNSLRTKTLAVVGGKVAFRIYEREAAPENADIDVICWSSDLSYLPTDMGYAIASSGVTSALTLSGVFVKTWGKVISSGSNYFNIDDGSQAAGGKGIKVSLTNLSSSIAVPAVGKYVTVAGLMSQDVSGPVIRPRVTSDVIIAQ
jgi:hypothetical protein